MNAGDPRSHGSQVEACPGGKNDHRGHPNLEELLIVGKTGMLHLGLSYGSSPHNQVAGGSWIDSVGSHGSMFLVSILICGWKSFIDGTSFMIASTPRAAIFTVRRSRPARGCFLWRPAASGIPGSGPRPAPQLAPRSWPRAPRPASSPSATQPELPTRTNPRCSS